MLRDAGVYALGKLLYVVSRMSVGAANLLIALLVLTLHDLRQKRKRKRKNDTSG